MKLISEIRFNGETRSYKSASPASLALNWQPSTAGRNFRSKSKKTGYTGYYFRVLEEGRVSADSSLQLLERDPQAVTIDYANRIMYRDQTNAAAMERLLQLPALSASWQATFRKRLAKLN